MVESIPSSLSIGLLPEDPRRTRVRADEPPMSHRRPRAEPDFWFFGLRRDDHGQARAILWVSRPQSW